MKDQFICLNCTLPICDETSKKCLFRYKKSRTKYMRDYYQAHREKKLAAANARHAQRRADRRNGAPVRMEIVD
jgi:hypothetical protein